MPLTKLKGIGTNLTAHFSRLGVGNVLDLLLFLPRRYEDRRTRVGFLRAAESREEAVTTGLVTAQDWFGPRRSILKLMVRDHEGNEAALLCFNREYLKTKFPVGSVVHVIGPFQNKYQELQSGQFEITPAGPKNPDPPGLGRILPVYPLTAGLHQTHTRRAVAQALGMTKGLQEEVPAEIRAAYSLGTWQEALKKVHTPCTPQEAEEGRRSLAWRELWFLSGGVLLERERRLLLGGKRTALPLTLLEEIKRRLPFSLTVGQEGAIADILEDLQSGTPMARLVQGDVGSGKTLVALLATLPLLEEGRQAAFLAPTELLARQHAENAAKLLAHSAVSYGLLTATTSSPERTQLLGAAKKGTVSLVFGTHALLNPEVLWKDLALVIVDEQQRFGVRQREELLNRGRGTHLLMMSATPIPRTLALSAFGDLDVSVIDGLPPGRLPVATYLCRVDHIQRVWNFLKKELEAGNQAYVIFPLIDESERRQLADLNSALAEVRQALSPFSVGAVHGKLPDQEKLTVMEDFSSGRILVLCATSVVEVGVDVPNATCMVIIHSEVFGLSALHQLRGRVGRGKDASSCFLVYSENLTDIARDRLKVLRETSDGFRIAEEDLRLRGPGEVLGNRQAGFLKLRAADLSRDSEFLLQTREAITQQIKNNPQGAWKALLRDFPLFNSER